MLQIMTPQRPEISPDSFLKRYQSERRRKKMAPYYQAIIAETEKHVAPVAMYQEFPLNRVSSLSAWTRPDTCAFTLALCTLGPTIETWSQELGKNDLLAAVILEETHPGLDRSNYPRNTRQNSQCGKRKKAACGSCLPAGGGSLAARDAKHCVCTTADQSDWRYAQ